MRKCFIRELELKGLNYVSQRIVPVNYKGIQLDADLRFDVVENLIVTELKAMEGILPVHEAIVLTYMRMLEKLKGIMINFHSSNVFKEGQKTLVNEYYAALPKI